MNPLAGVRESALTVRGHFNPLILQPDWLLAQGLVSELDYRRAIESLAQLVTPDFVRGEYPQIRFDALREQLVVTTVETSQSPALARDFVVGVLKALPHTPVEQVEITHSVHATLAEDTRSALGRFVDAEPWRAVLGGAVVDMFAIKAELNDGRGEVDVIVETSGMEQFDLYVAASLTWTVPDAPGQTAATWVSDTLNKRWQETLDLASKVFSTAIPDA